LLMHVSLYILECRQIKDINFEFVFSEYQQQVLGLSANDESLKKYIYSKTVCFKAFQTLYSLGLVETLHSDHTRPFASRCVSLAVTPLQTEKIIKGLNCPTWVESWAKVI